ncbi:MAG: methyl-accepting chemotaxis protein [Geitlerinemataceae cyanobacterium]
MGNPLNHNSSSRPDVGAAPSHFSSLETAQNADYLLNMLLQANSLEQSGDGEAARILYEEIVTLDCHSPWGATAQKALQSLKELGLGGSSDLSSGSPPNDDESEASTLQLLSQSPDDSQFPPSANDASAGVRLSVWRGWRRAWRHVDVGTKLRTMAIASVLLPLGVMGAALLWIEPNQPPSPSSNINRTAGDRLPLKAALSQHRWALTLGGVTALLTLWVALLVANRLAAQLRAVSQYALALGSGMAGETSQDPVKVDELTGLTRQLRYIAHLLERNRSQILTLDRQREREVDRQKRDKERAQKQAIDLLLYIESVRSGNLTVKVPTVEGEIGAIADAFNATIGSLNHLVAQVKTVTEGVTRCAHSSQGSVESLSHAARVQSEELKRALDSVVAISESISRVSQSTQEAAEIARRAAQAAQEGENAMTQTVASMNKIRTSVANSSKKAKRLAESAQEISQILESIVGIAEQANLLAFNASIEASRTGERGQGFRQVADEVRRLAAQVGESAQNIGQLIDSIQEETAQVLNIFELGTSQVVAGTQWVDRTQQTLRGLTWLSQQIDGYLQDVATNTVDQAGASKTVSQTVETVARIASTTASEAQSAIGSLQELTEQVETLRSSVAQFQVK